MGAKKKIEEERRGVEAEAKKKIELAIAQEILAKKLVDEEDSKAKAEEAIAAAAAVVEAKAKEEGGELRIRSAYLDWCLEFSKKPDKVRIEQFKKNYLLLEGVAKEEGKDIKLNEYADFTAAEFEKEIQAKQEVKEKEKQKQGLRSKKNIRDRLKLRKKLNLKKTNVDNKLKLRKKLKLKKKNVNDKLKLRIKLK